MATTSDVCVICGTKIAINAFLRNIARMLLLITEGLRARPIHAKTTLMIASGKNALATKFWPKWAKISQNGHNFSCV